MDLQLYWPVVSLSENLTQGQPKRKAEGQGKQVLNY